MHGTRDTPKTRSTWPLLTSPDTCPKMEATPMPILPPPIPRSHFHMYTHTGIHTYYTHVHTHPHRDSFTSKYTCVHTDTPILSSSMFEYHRIPVKSPLFLLCHPLVNPSEIFVIQAQLSPPQETCLQSSFSGSHI